MRGFSKSSAALFFLLVGIIACSTLVNPALADSDEENDNWFGWGSESKEDTNDNQHQGKSLNDESSGAGDHSHHDHSSGNHQGHEDQPVLAAASPIQVSSMDPAKQAGGGMQNANYAAHNESCSPRGKSCTERQNLECSSTDGTGRCICVPGFVYVRQTETCWPIPKSEQDSCQHDVQCHAGSWGGHSRCDKHTSRCQCYDYTTGGKRDMKLVDGVCYIQKSIGDLCNSHEECDKTIRGNAHCKLGDHQSAGGGNYIGSCQCVDNNMHWKPLNACLPLATKLKDACVVTEQCQNGTLGRHSKCVENGVCECYSPHEGQEMVYYEKLAKCFKRKNYNDTCNEVDECRASLGPDVECGVLPGFEEGGDNDNNNYNGTAVCHCPKGKVCRNSAFSSLFASSVYTLGFAFTAAIIGVSSLMTEMGNFAIY